ncbi:hypothetical protein PVK06_047679 [Gossypium arboreum]|uniref:Uncharacterized protein n=1 Tax=Gossypium arboreum TaxID=29729 RepID=A0ABR0MDZ3_GOSAR|nr:hypothetical protein PVK06_047679 [Gossypium arboreum]
MFFFTMIQLNHYANKIPRRRLRDLSIVQNSPNSKETNSEQQTAIGSSNVSNTTDELVEIQRYLGIIAQNANTLPINYESWHHMPDNNKNQALDNTKELSSGQKFGRLQLFDITYRKKDGPPMTIEAVKIMKLMDKRAEYKAIASSDSSVNLDDIDNRIITDVLGSKRYGRVRFQGSFANLTQYFGSSLQQYMPSGNHAQAEVQR